MEQKNNSNKQKKLMPVELLVDMIKTSISLNGVKMASKHLRTNINGRTPFQISGLKSLDDLKKRLYQLVINIKMEKNVLKKYWHKFARNILTSSGIVYSLVGENFKNMKKTIMDTNKEKESQEALREAVGPDTNIIAGFVKGLVDSDARQLLIKILHHMENQNEVNNEMRKCLTDMKGLLNKQSFLLARQANSGSMMVAELRTFLNMPNKEESDSVKMALKRTKSYPPGKMLKCDFCDREYDVKHYERHLLTRKHLQAVEGKKRKIDCEQMEQEHGEDTGAGPSTSSAFAPK